MNGTVTRVVPRTIDKKGGYGFIRGEDDRDYFFHAMGLRGGLTLEGLEANRTRVRFDPVAVDGPARKGNGLRAANVYPEGILP